MRQRVVELRNTVLRHLAVPSLVVLLGLGSALAQSGSNPEQAKPPATAPADAAKDSQNQNKADEYTQAAQAINGPASNRECVLLGLKVVRLIYRDDPGTAVRQLELYDRFGCPGGHIQGALRCLTRFKVDDKVPGKDLNSLVQACWINPAAQPEGAATAAATQPPAPATNGSPEPNPAPSK